MIIHSITDVGKMRHSNQDSYFAGQIIPDAVLAIVCDGMGGANAGNVASETAVKSISEYILHSYRSNMDYFEIEAMLKNAIVSANLLIYDMSLKDEALSGMGTTAVIAFVRDDTAVIAHVGDSRVYLADDKLNQLTRDHSVVQSLVESGKISPEAAKVHPRKNVITRAIGAEENIIADTGQIKFTKGQTLLLCSDGLSNYVDGDTILEVINKTDPENAPKSLVELANNGGGGDNITVVCLTNKA